MPPSYLADRRLAHAEARCEFLAAVRGASHRSGDLSGELAAKMWVPCGMTIDAKPLNLQRLAVVVVMAVKPSLSGLLITAFADSWLYNPSSIDSAFKGVSSRFLDL